MFGTSSQTFAKKTSHFREPSFSHKKQQKKIHHKKFKKNKKDWFTHFNPYKDKWKWWQKKYLCADGQEPKTWYADLDGDGFGDETDSKKSCESELNYVAIAGDCNDMDALIHPQAEELCDDVDNNCDTFVDNECTRLKCFLTMSLASADAKFVGEHVGDWAGYTVSAAGDVDADGFDDILVGSPLEDSSGNDAGAAYLLYGPFEGEMNLAHAGARFKGVWQNDLAGTTLSAGGDINEDGYDDVLIGSFGLNTARISVMFGPMYGFKNLVDAGITIIGETGYKEKGMNVTTAGDVNGDGHVDIMVSSQFLDVNANDDGAVYIIYGPHTGGLFNLADADVKIVGEAAGDMAGVKIISAGDLNADGYDDVMIASQHTEGENYDSGKVSLLYGPLIEGEMSLADADIKFVSSDLGSWKNVSMYTAGDTDGDGFADVVMGVHYEDDQGLHTAESFLFLGPVTEAVIELTAADVIFQTEQELRAHGLDVASIESVNSDIYSDVLIGDPHASVDNLAAGVVALFLGPLTEEVFEFDEADVRFVGEAEGDLAGFATAPAGDVNADGLQDFLIGAYKNDAGGDDAGAAYLILGSDEIFGEERCDRFAVQ